MPATVHNGGIMTRSKGRRIPQMDYFVCQVTILAAKFAEFLFHELG